MVNTEKNRLFRTLCSPIMAAVFMSTAMAQVPNHASLTNSTSQKQHALLSDFDNNNQLIDVLGSTHSAATAQKHKKMQYPAIQSGDGDDVGFENDLKGIFMLYDATGSTYSNGSLCQGHCYTSLKHGAEQWVDVAADPSAWAKPGYSLCTSINYDATGKPSCVGYLGYISVSLNHTENLLKPKTDSRSQEFFKKYDVTFTKKPTENMYSITSNYPSTPAPAPTKTPSLPNPQSYSSGLTYRGVNLAGSEFGTSAAKAQPPIVKDAAWEAQYGVNTFRIPIRAEYALPKGVGGPIDVDYINPIKKTMSSLLAKGYSVVLDLHNYMRFCPGKGAGVCSTLLKASQLQSIWSSLLGTAAFGDIATKYPKHFMMDLMNEPNGVDAATVVTDYNQTIAAIRKGGFSNLLLLEGTMWSGLHSWRESGNAAAFTKISDSQSNVAINVHQYFDAYYSGAGATCVDPQTLLANIHAGDFVTWLTTNKQKAFVSEFGAPNNPTCQQDLSTFVNYLQKNSNDATKGYGFLGWTLWSAGHAWDDNDLMNFQGPDGVNFPLWKSLFVAQNFITPVAHSDMQSDQVGQIGQHLFNPEV